MRGRHLRTNLASGVASGLSPRVRGRPLGYASSTRRVPRSIPTCAGQTIASGLYPLKDGSGSIPTCAGQTRIAYLLVNVVRSIPTCAGQTIMTSFDWMLERPGLSPRVRGRRGTACRIPRSGADSRWVYPHVCGADVAVGANVCGAAVRSGAVYPHVCGADMMTISDAVIAHGSIPTCAGQTSNPPSPS